MTAGSGLSSRESLARYDLLTLSWKTSQASLLPMEDAPSVRSSVTWPRSGMTRSGSAYRLPRLVPHTSVTGSSSFPTLGAFDGKAPGLKNPNSNMTKYGGVNSLSGLARAGLLPTMVRADASRKSATYGRGNNTLIGAVKLLPTLTRKGKYNRRGSSSKSGNGLATVVGGNLNPLWSEWFMGFPQQWTELPPSETP